VPLVTRPRAPGPGIGRRRLLRGATALALLAGLARPARGQGGAAGAEAAGQALAAAATAFLLALPQDLRARATFAFDDRERLNWGYVPRRRAGLAFGDMPAAGRAAAHDLLRASLSPEGYQKALNVIRLEDVLRQLETFGGLFRDPENYLVSVFGIPGAAAPWGWRLEGHHLSLNFTLRPARTIAVTPAFLGANPAEVRAGGLTGLRTLGREEDLGRALVLGED
jgi:hypothetical protein